jgi:MYXO-CTERM domain-containing protein
MVLADRSADIKHALDAYHDDVGYNDGCSCRTDGGNRSLGIGWLVLFALGGLARRSRSRRCAS